MSKPVYNVMLGDILIGTVGESDYQVGKFLAIPNVTFKSIRLFDSVNAATMSIVSRLPLGCRKFITVQEKTAIR